jgi:uncharacterized protein YbaR (Trm112 family)
MHAENGKGATVDITFNCDACQQSIAIDEAGAGSIVECPICRAKVLVPLPSEQPAATPSSLTQCPDCSREVSKRAATCPHCGAPLAAAASTQHSPVPTVMACPLCKIQLVKKETTETGPIGFFVGGLLFAFGALLLWANASVGDMGLMAAGGVLMIVGILIVIGSRHKYTMMVCPSCNREVSKL